MLGDSLTQGWQWDRSWGQQISHGRKILNFGLGGDRIEHLLWRLEQGLVGPARRFPGHVVDRRQQL